jgi:membrane glycosyltransferase
MDALKFVGLNARRECADWMMRFGGAYEHMIVLDADSLTEDRAIVRLAARARRRGNGRYSW